MKHIKRFNEAIVDWETDNLKDFYKEVKVKFKNSNHILVSDLREIASKYDIEVVNYETFYNELPTEKLKKDAPPKGVNLGLVNPVTNNLRIVCDGTSISEKKFNYLYHILKHENVHIGQMDRKSDRKSGEYLGDVRNSKAYFSNKDEIMAFSQSISDMIMNSKPNNMEEAIKELRKNGLWSHIKNSVDDKTKNRYKKYIYLYLEKELEK